MDVEETLESKTETASSAEEEEEEETLKPGDSALQFLENIDPDVLDLCMFEDNLITTSDDGKTLGEFKASVEKIKEGGEVLLLVHAASQGKVEDTPMGTSITAYLRPDDLSLVKQTHQEFVKVPGHELEKRTEMEVDEETGLLTVRRHVIQGPVLRKTLHKFPKEKTVGFITEGTNLLLQRLLIKRGFHGETMTFITLDFDSGHLVPTVYKPLPERKQKVGRQELEVQGIERRIMSVTDLPYTWQSYFMEDGHLSMRVQIGSPAVVVLEKVPRQIERIVMEEKPVFEKQPLNWEDDMEMDSKFFQRKEELKAGHETYLREHPEAKALLGDFFQFLLLRKPDNVVDFAAEFFVSFSNVLPDASSYKHSDTELPSTHVE